MDNLPGNNDARGRAARSFEELRVYQRARELANAVYAVTRGAAFEADRGLVDQVRRAAVSVVSNIAEGYERGASAEFIQFLYIAKGSCGEVRAQAQIALDQAYLSREEYARLEDMSRRTSGMLSKFIAHLQGSDYRGEKFSRPQRQQAQAAERRLEALIHAQRRSISQSPVERQPDERGRAAQQDERGRAAQPDERGRAAQPPEGI